MAKNKHDLIFRKILSNTTMFRAFCEVYLPQQLRNKIDFEKLELKKLSGNFIRLQAILNISEKSRLKRESVEELKEEVADVVYSAALKEGGEVLLIIHVEHQSTPDKIYPIRNALYDIAAIKDYAEQHPGKQLPVPVSFLYYHGRLTPYPYPVDIMEMFADINLAQENFLKPYLIDLGQFSEVELLKHGDISGLEVALKHSYDKQVLESGVRPFIEAIKGCKDIELRRALYQYTISAWEVDPVLINKAYKEAIPDDRRFIMTAEEQLIQKGLRKGRQEGRQEGVSLGERRKAKEIALEMLRNNQSIEMVSKCVKLSFDEVLKLKNSLLVH